MILSRSDNFLSPNLPSAFAFSLSEPDGGLRVHSVQGKHAGNDVVVHVAVIQPRARVIWLHVKHLHAPGEQFYHVHPHVHGQPSVAVPVGGVQVHLCALNHHIPAHPLPLLHRQPGQVAVDVAVDRMHEVTFGESRMIEPSQQDEV